MKRDLLGLVKLAIKKRMLRPHGVPSMLHRFWGLLFVWTFCSSTAIAATFLAGQNSEIKVAGWGCYYTSTGESAGTGSFTVTVQPKHGVLSYGTGLSNSLVNGNRIPVAVAYYTWTDTDSNAETDDFALHWSAQLSGCSTDDNISVQKVASFKNQGRPNGDCPKTCDGNPIDVATGNKIQVETDFIGGEHTGLEFQRYYNSLAGNTASVLGAAWRGTWMQSLRVDATNGVITATRADGRAEKFSKNSAGLWLADPDVTDQLAPVVDSNNRQTGWQLLTKDDDSELYNLDGYLLSVSNRAGQTVTLGYDGNHLLTEVTGFFGHKLAFVYDVKGRIASMKVPDGGVYSYGYDANNNLVSMTNPDKTIRRYTYEDKNFPHALTGIIDENGTRFATWSYDAKGRAISSQHAGGAELTRIAYKADGSISVTDALDNQHGYNFVTQFDVVKPTDVNGVAVKTLGAKSYSYDANGFVASKTDFNNNVTTYQRDAQGLELSRTEAAGTALARIIKTEWHSAFHLPSKIIEPDRETAFTYDGNGNLIQRTVTDGVQSRTWTYDYNAAGQVLSEDGPRADVSDVTRYTYDDSGNLSSITNALGHTIKLTTYDANGRLLRVEDANGLATTFTYDPRGRLIAIQQGTEITQYSRDAVGQLTKITKPDDSYTAMSYDDAHRLVKVSDQLGNHIDYTLDALGNRLKQEVYDPKSTLTQTLSAQFDGLSRLTALIGAEGQKTTYFYDDNDNPIGFTDSLNNNTALAYDALNRMMSSVDPTGNTVTMVYDASDNPVEVTDSLGHQTRYSYDGLGNRLTTDSPDTGLSDGSYDAVGNKIASVDARGQKVGYGYDVLNRLNQIQYGDNQAITLLYDQGSNAIGRLTQISDPNGSTRWAYDAYGRVATRTSTSGSLTLITRYAYADNGRLSSITYPSGQVIQLSYDRGLVTGLTVNGAALVSDIRYQPFGAPAEWLFGNGGKSLRQFDLEGRPVAYDLGNRTRQLSYDAAGRIVDYKDSDMNHDQSFGYDALSRLISFSSVAAQVDYSYDANGNRTSLKADSNQVDSVLDSASNRLLVLSQNAAAIKNYSYDDAGNLISDGSHTFNYDGRGRLVKATGGFGQEEYRINGLGQRVAKVTGPAPDLAGDANQDGTLSATDLRLIVLMAKGTVPANSAADCNHDGNITTVDASCTQAKLADMRLHPAKYVQAGTYFVYDEAGHLLGEYEQSGKAIQETVWLGDMPVAVLKDGKNYFVYADHLNAPRAIADGLGNVVWRWDSDAFGTTKASEDPDADGNSFVYNLRFPGQYYDKSTGLHYNGFRDYAPSLGRYIQSDPIGLVGGLNTYAYVGANPISKIDQEGLDVIVYSDGLHEVVGIQTRSGLKTFGFGVAPSSESIFASGSFSISSSSVRGLSGITSSLGFTSKGYIQENQGYADISGTYPVRVVPYSLSDGEVLVKELEEKIKRNQMPIYNFALYNCQTFANEYADKAEGLYFSHTTFSIPQSTMVLVNKIIPETSKLGQILKTLDKSYKH